MSAPPCTCPRKPSPARARVDVATYTVHPQGPCRAEEDLGDALDMEVRAHAATREALAAAKSELVRAQPALDACLAVLAVLNTPTTPAEQDAHLGRLAGPLFQLEQALHDFNTPPEASPSASTPTPSAEVSHG